MDVVASFVYDMDPRYGWVHIGSDHEKFDIVIQTSDGSFGYTFKDGEFYPHCICSARHAGECCCQTGDWS